MKSRERKRKKGEAFLISVAESIGSTMGTIVGRANAAQKAVTQSPVARTVKREGKKLVGKSKKAKTTMPADLKRRKPARAGGAVCVARTHPPSEPCGATAAKARAA
jgi:hypothetical protein